MHSLLIVEIKQLCMFFCLFPYLYTVIASPCVRNVYSLCFPFIYRAVLESYSSASVIYTYTRADSSFLCTQMLSLLLCYESFGMRNDLQQTWQKQGMHQHRTYINISQRTPIQVRRQNDSSSFMNHKALLQQKPYS